MVSLKFSRLYNLLLSFLPEISCCRYSVDCSPVVDGRGAHVDRRCPSGITEIAGRWRRSSVMEGSDTVFIVRALAVFVSGVTVNGILSVDKVMVGGVLSLDVESEREIVILVGKVMVAGKVTVVGKAVMVGAKVESLGVESESEMVSKVEVSVIVVVSSGVGICSPTLDTSGSSTNIPDRPAVIVAVLSCSPTLNTSGSSTNIPDRPGVFGIRAESAK